MNRSSKDMTLMVVIGALLLFAVYNFVFRPQRADLASVGDDLSSIEQQTSDARSLLQVPTAEPATVQPDAASAAVPDHPELATLLRQLQAGADDTGVSLVSVDPATLAESPQGVGGSVALTITASGTADAVTSYLERMRDMERVLVVAQLAIDTQPDQVAQLTISARVFTRETPIVAEAPEATPRPAAAGT